MRILVVGEFEVGLAPGVSLCQSAGPLGSRHRDGSGSRWAVVAHDSAVM